MVWAVVGATVVGAGVSLYEGYENRKQAGAISSEGLGIAEQEWSAQQGYQQQLNQLLANPASVTSLPGYQFTMDQGTQAVSRASAAGGFLNSGNEGTALVQFGQGLATSYLSQQENLLASLSGLQAASSSAQNISAATGASNNSNNQLNQLLQQLGLGAGYLSRNNNFGSGMPGYGPSIPSSQYPGNGGVIDPGMGDPFTSAGNAPAAQPVG